MKRYYVRHTELGHFVVEAGVDAHVYASGQVLDAEEVCAGVKLVASGIPNLDAMSRGDLGKVAVALARADAVYLGELLWPSVPQEDRERALLLLARYAATKRRAMSSRLEGFIETALSLEMACDTIYQELPSWARSW